MKKQLLIIVLLFIATVIWAQPKIASFSPTFGQVGSTMIIKGKGFNKIVSNNVVFFGAVKAAITSVTDTSITVTVPSGATYENVSVTDISTGLTGYASSPFNVTFCGDSLMMGDSFSDKNEIKTGDMLNSVKIADFDGDGKSDIITVGYATVMVYRNTSTLDTFIMTKVITDILYTPRSVLVGDFNGDGKLDFAVVCQYPNYISVYKNTSTVGSISFQKVSDYPTGKNPVCIAIGDLNQDGKPDLAVTCTNADSVFIYRNTSSGGNISFDSRISLQAGNYPQYVVISDFNGDSLPDIAVANYSSSPEYTLSVFENTSSNHSISFNSENFFDGGSYPSNIGLGDFDGDGRIDIALSNYQDKRITVDPNRSSSNISLYTNSYNFAVGTAPANITVNDFNGDGKPDIAVDSRMNFSLSVLQNTSYYDSVRYNLKTVFEPYFELESGFSPYGITSGDLNGDGKPDIVSANEDSTLSVFFNIGTGVHVFATTPTDSIGAGTSIDLGVESDVSTGMSYKWSTGDITSSIHISPLTTTTYDVTGTNSKGCKGYSSLTIKVTSTTPATPTITLNNGIVHSSSITGNQWYDSNGKIDGATNQDYTPTQNGTYYAIVTQNGVASEKSNSITVTSFVTAVANIESDNYTIYPNPTTSSFTITTEGETMVEIYNGNSTLILKKHIACSEIFPVKNMPAGIYFVKIITTNKVITKNLIIE